MEPKLTLIMGILITTGVTTIALKIIWDWLKNRPTNNPLGMAGRIATICPMDQSGATTAISEIKKTVEDNRGDLHNLGLKVDHGVSIAERNSESYTKFIIALNDLKNMIKNNTAAVRNLTEESTKQTAILRSIKNNGGASGH